MVRDQSKKSSSKRHALQSFSTAAGRMRVHGECPAAVERLCSARRFDEWPVDSRSVGISVVLFCEHAFVSHCLLLRLSSGKQEGGSSNNSTVRKGLRRDLYRPPRLPSAACGWRLGTVTVWRRCMRRRTENRPPDL